MHELNYENIFDRLFPIMRSITGPGYRASLEIMSEFIPFSIEKFPSGQQIFDWTVPNEWVINDAYLLDPDGKKIIDMHENNLCVLGYSTPIDTTMPLSELQKNLFSIPEKPDSVPYVFSYYKQNWGLCLSHNQRQNLKEGSYKVKIDSHFKDGFVELGISKLVSTEKVSKGTVVISSYLCHPSLANNELSGPLVMIGLYKKIKSWKKRYHDYVFLVNPETIGSICYLSKYGNDLIDNMTHGIVLTCLGGPQKRLTYKLSRVGDSNLDSICKLLAENQEIELRKFDVGGSDERQFCSPGFNLPMGQFARTVYAEYDGYHNSSDDKNFVQLENFPNTVSSLEKILYYADLNHAFEREMPFCELQLGKRNLYPNINSEQTSTDSSDEVKDKQEQLLSILNILANADGLTTPSAIVKDTGISMENLFKYINFLLEKNLINYVK